MAEIVNLRTARKARKRADKERAADENRARFGRSKASKRTRAAEGERAKAALDGHRRIAPDRDGE